MQLNYDVLRLLFGPLKFFLKPTKELIEKRIAQNKSRVRSNCLARNYFLFITTVVYVCLRCKRSV